MHSNLDLTSKREVNHNNGFERACSNSLLKRVQSKVIHNSRPEDIQYYSSYWLMFFGHDEFDDITFDVHPCFIKVLY